MQVFVRRSPCTDCGDKVTFISFPRDTIESFFQMAGSCNQQENFVERLPACSLLPRKRSCQKKRSCWNSLLALLHYPRQWEPLLQPSVLTGPSSKEPPSSAWLQSGALGGLVWKTIVCFLSWFNLSYLAGESLHFTGRLGATGLVISSAWTYLITRSCCCRCRGESVLRQWMCVCALINGAYGGSFSRATHTRQTKWSISSLARRYWWAILSVTPPTPEPVMRSNGAGCKRGHLEASRKVCCVLMIQVKTQTET